MLSVRRNSTLTIVVSFVLVILTILQCADGHGRLMDPPARTSLWRLPAFSNCPRTDKDDNGINCGGDKEKCGVCGDPIWESTPRKGEELGSLDCNRTTRSYTMGGLMEVTVKITEKHGGAFEFRLCARNATNRKSMSVSDDARRNCLARHLLADESGNTRFSGISRKGDFRYRLRLPSGVQCDYCFLRWRYLAGNSQEYYGCSDIQIRPAATSASQTTATTSTTTRKTTTRPTTTRPTTTRSTTTRPTTTRTTTTRTTTTRPTTRSSTTTTSAPIPISEKNPGVSLAGENSLSKSNSAPLSKGSQHISILICVTTILRLGL